ncbi:hypothetical protein MIR68_001049 [Amoeboaphelidium protococcarum]|nr:hypothetical protein MIR68_001049 [Amoeboaphelidium protococcarum]
MADPDRVWISEQEQNCLAKLTIELKTPWSFESLHELIPRYEYEYCSFEAKKAGSYESVENIKRGKTIRAVKQIYGYMTLNRHRYGVLTIFNDTVFLRKIEDPQEEGRSVLECSPVMMIAIGLISSHAEILASWPEALDTFDHEVEVYQALESLQGLVIPKFISYGTLQDGMQVIVLENVGSTMTTEQHEQRKEEVNEALKIHALGYEHGNLDCGI